MTADNMFGFIQEKYFRYKGYPCVVLFNSLGFRCGYVGLPKTSIFYGEDYKRIPVYCHGNLSYGEFYLSGRFEVDTYWIGFACNSYCDGFDTEKAKEYFKNRPDVLKGMEFIEGYQIEKNKYFEPRNLEFAENTCRLIVDQIIMLERARGNIMENNRAFLKGEILEEFTLDHEVNGAKIYKTYVRTERLSGVSDIVPVLMPEWAIGNKTNLTGQLVEIDGRFCSFNLHDENKSKLLLNVFAEHFEICQKDDVDFANEIELTGFISTAPTYRKTPKCREISDLLVCVHRDTGKKSYIPCITWGRNARFTGTIEVGTEIHLVGRIQSREYVKRFEDGTEETRTAYEVSVNRVEVVS